MENFEVAAAIIKEDGTYLICQRAADDECPLHWEFPGGKREAGETIEDCIIREMREELAIQVEIRGIFAETIYHFNNKEIKFTFFLCDIIAGEIELKVHAQIKWVKPEKLLAYKYLPADIEIVERLSGKSEIK